VRLRKDTVARGRPYAYRDYGNYKNVPNNWNITQNMIFECGNVEMGNVRTFTSAFRGNTINSLDTEGASS
jgi:hypothetical protein